jgi:hypothetical protein
MKRNKARYVRSAIGAAGISLLLAAPVASALPSVAGADPTCYTGCTTSNTGITASAGPQAQPTSVSTPSSGLAFTGADIGEMAIIGVASVGVGVVLVSRRRRTA